MSGAIQFQGVHYKSEDGVHILRGITGSFIEGEVTTLVGPSGAGKSTLLKLCNGLHSPTSGEIKILNKNVNDYDPVQLRKEVGMALQSAPMVEGDVFHNLALPMLLQGKSLPENEAEKLLEDVGLEGEHLRRNIKDLSGGQRQKVSIARTLVNRPKIMLLDEITSSLDQVSQKEIDELIVKISKKYGVTIIWITHNLQQALKVGTYAWMLKEGELLESGKSERLHTSTNEHVQAFVKGEIE